MRLLAALAIRDRYTTKERTMPILQVKRRMGITIARDAKNENKRYTLTLVTDYGSQTTVTMNEREFSEFIGDCLSIQAHTMINWTRFVYNPYEVYEELE